jgi:hypothetical protein
MTDHEDDQLRPNLEPSQEEYLRLFNRIAPPVLEGGEPSVMTGSFAPFVGGESPVQYVLTIENEVAQHVLYPDDDLVVTRARVTYHTPFRVNDEPDELIRGEVTVQCDLTDPNGKCSINHMYVIEEHGRVFAGHHYTDYFDEDGRRISPNDVDYDELRFKKITDTLTDEDYFAIAADNYEMVNRPIMLGDMERLQLLADVLET